MSIVKCKLWNWREVNDCQYDWSYVIKKRKINIFKFEIGSASEHRWEAKDLQLIVVVLYRLKFKTDKKLGLILFEFDVTFRYQYAA